MNYNILYVDFLKTLNNESRRKAQWRKAQVEKTPAFLYTRRKAQHYFVKSGEKPSFLYHNYRI